MKFVPISNILLLPFMIALLAFVVFFFRAIVFTGLRRLKKFTAIMLGVFAVLIVLYFFKFISDTRLIPTGIIDISQNGTYRTAKLICAVAFLIIAIVKINKEKSSWWLNAVWVLIMVLNIAAFAWQGYLYVTYEIPEIAFNAPKNMGMVLAPAINPKNYLTAMIYPICWIIISGFSLYKIKNEKRKLVLHTYPSYSKITSL